MAWDNPYVLSQELRTVQAATAASADNDPVGQAIDLSPSAHYLVAPSTGTRPLLGSTGGRGAWAQLFDGTTSRWLQVRNSKRAFNHLWRTGTGAILGWARSDLDGSFQYLFDNCNGTPANGGMYLGKTAANKLQFLLARAGAAVVNYTTTASFPAASGWLPVIIRLSGTTGSIQIGDNAAEPFALGTLAASTVNAQTDLTFGQRESDTTAARWRGAISDWVILNRDVTADEIAAWKAYNPSRRSRNPGRVSGSGTALSDLSQLHTWYDASQEEFLWTDTAKTVPVSADTHIARVVGNCTGDRYARNAVGAADGTSLVYRTGVQNGLPGLRGDGVDDSNILENGQLFPGARCMTLVMVVRNLDATNGSHFLYNGGSSYLAVVGSNYAGHPVGQKRAVLHPSIVTTSVEAQLVNQDDTANILVFVRNGSTWTAYVNGVQYAPQTSAGYWVPSEIGRAAIAGWELDGYVHEIGYSLIDHSEATVLALTAGLAEKWGVANVTV